MFSSDVLLSNPIVLSAVMDTSFSPLDITCTHFGDSSPCAFSTQVTQLYPAAIYVPLDLFASFALRHATTTIAICSWQYPLASTSTWT